MTMFAAATFPPRALPADATHGGRGLGPLPRGRSAEFTVRQSVAISTGLRGHLSVRLPGRQNHSGGAESEELQRVRVPDAAAAFAAPLRRGRWAWRSPLTSSRRAATSACVGPPLSREGRETTGRACFVLLGKTLERRTVTTPLKARQAGVKTEFL